MRDAGRRLWYLRRRLRARARYWWIGRFGPMPTPRRWVFLVGCSNSGTTLLHDLLARHPAVAVLADEGQFCTDLLLRARDVGLSRLWALAPERFRMDESSHAVDANRLKRHWGAAAAHHTRPVLLEKSPPNALRTRWLQAHFEDAHFIGLVRNGYAVAEGIRRREGHPLDAAACQWARANELMLEDFAHLRRAQVVRYEDLTDAPKRVLESLLPFLGLEGLDPEVAKAAWVVHGETSPIANMNARALAALTPEDRATVEREAGPVLRRLGYAA